MEKIGKKIKIWKILEKMEILMKIWKKMENLEKNRIPEYNNSY